MRIYQVAKICSGQDGAIWNNYLFRFNSKGQCSVYRISDFERTTNVDTTAQEIGRFSLDRSDIIAPHSNSVMFGTEFYSCEDEFPLLYSNIYNNYAKSENRLCGLCCVYRIQRVNNLFKSTLVQLIEIAFTTDPNHWCSKAGNDVRPYGNFTIDRERNIYHAFTMLDEAKITRYFSFSLPKLHDGIFDNVYNVNKVSLEVTDIISSFDCEYHRYVQGACCHKGKIYSLEGFTNNTDFPPALRIVDSSTQKQDQYIPFADYGLTIEPEFIDFKDDICYYSDNAGNLYIIEL